MIADKTFWFIRHGESEGNAGLPTPSAGEIHLTNKGIQQAECIPDQIIDAPDMFVVSPFCRTSETAAPTLKKFPNVPVETWNIQEYTYLPEKLHDNTTLKQRRWPAIRYFMRMDPELILGPGAESFNQLIARVDSTLEKLVSGTSSTIILFSHGWFMRTLIWRLIFFPGLWGGISLGELKDKMPTSDFLFKLFSRNPDIGKNQIKHFLRFSGIISVPNGSILKLRWQAKQAQFKLDQVTVDHIKPELRGTHLSDR
ncbi:MAG: histidine phosphatase family protein [Chloroflexota bacterium]